jgi:dolichyl-diphosphooligosaccharide--protein glycosyltransferase
VVLDRGALSGRGPTRLRALWLPLALFAASFGVRIANAGFVFVEGRVRFPSGRDELYHVRKIVYQVLRFPELLDFDPYVSFPFGATPVWPPFLDFGIAAVVRLLAAPAEALAVERVIVWIPPLLGAATVAALAEIGRRHFSLLTGLVAGLWLALLPAHHVHSQLGQVDHQVGVGLTTLLLLGTAMTWFAAPAARPRNAWAAAAGLWIALSLLVSPGALLAILPVQAVAVVWTLAAAAREQAVARARSAALAHGVAALLVTPACLASGPFPGLGAHSPLVLSSFQPLWLGAGAAGLALAAELWQRSRAGASRAARGAAAFALAAVAAGVAFAGVPGLRGSLAYAGGWFTREEAFLSTVVELQPLLFPAGRFDPVPALQSLTAGLLLFPLAWLWLALRRGLDPNARPKTLLLLVWSAPFFVLALAQERFANAFAPGLALTLGAALEELRASAARRFARRARLAFAAGAALLVVAALAPSALGYRDLFAYSRYALRQERPRVPADSRRKVVVEDAARFLREASPPTLGFLDAKLRPEYGVLTCWEDGHLVRYRAERPTVQDNFGSFADRRAWDLARDYFAAEDEGEAVRIAERLGARFTVATRQGSGQSFGASPHSLGQRLWRRLGNGIPGADGGAGSPALAQHRLFWVGDLSGRPRDLEAPAPDRVAVFEIVPGASVAGRASPGAKVSFELALRAGPGRLWYRARTQASAEGRYEIRLPYPTDAEVSREVGAAGPYRVRSGGRSAELEVREAEVRAGATLAGPALEEEA